MRRRGYSHSFQQKACEKCTKLERFAGIVEAGCGKHSGSDQRKRTGFFISLCHVSPSQSFKVIQQLDCQGLVARLVLDFVLLTTAVEVAGRWRELAERLVKVSRQQMDAYEAPHRDKSGTVDSEVRDY
ncbi:SH3 domain-binding protein 4 [Dissostichus eleginoides]|uniref:SH3 domain-binding protein 4 n=1 Tax=Dissostichus eleginoides TaxID=100907 RepID=A0AAD9FI08_DISEL|nr:SH3 domain-binding protein 4 [Dissostichus eleginoides]